MPRSSRVAWKVRDMMSTPSRSVPNGCRAVRRRQFFIERELVGSEGGEDRSQDCDEGQDSQNDQSDLQGGVLTNFAQSGLPKRWSAALQGRRRAPFISRGASLPSIIARSPGSCGASGRPRSRVDERVQDVDEEEHDRVEQGDQDHETLQR